MPSDRGSDERYPRVLVDVMCGRLARYLRFAGYDAAYAGDRCLETDAAVRHVAQSEDRQIITRDRELGARVGDALVLTETDLRAQLAALADAGYDLSLPSTPTRCGVCNGRLTPVQAESTPDDVPDPAEIAVYRCQACGQRFWRGSHWDRVGETFEQIS